MVGAEQFLSALWGNEKDAVKQIAVIKGSRVTPIVVVDIQDAIKKAVEYSTNGFDVYHACGLFQTGQSRKADNALGAYGFWLDIDCGKEKAANGKGYESQDEAIFQLSQFLSKNQLPEATYIISSGYGLHVYFFCSERIEVETWKQTATKIKSLCEQYGFKADPSRTSDIASILRFPNTKNYKDRTCPKDVSIRSYSNRLLAVDHLINTINNAYAGICQNGEIEIIKKMFPLEKLGAKVNFEVFEDTPDNRTQVLDMARVAYPEGITDRTCFYELGMVLASLVFVNQWPELVAREILDEICSKPKNANRDNNDKEWNNYVIGTREKHSRGEPILGIGTLRKKALEKGWKPINTNAYDANVLTNFALIQLGSKVGIVDMNQVSHVSTKTPLSIFSREDGGILIKRAIAKSKPDVDAGKLLKKWMDDPTTKMYTGVELNPNGTTTDYINLFHGLSITPKRGKYPLIHSFLLEIICSNSEKHFNYLWGWLAHLVQRTGEKPGVSILLLGGQGTGKGTFATKIVRPLFSDHFLHLQSDKAITGDFNDSLESSLIIFADEAFFSGDKRGANILKAIETESRIHVNPKFQPSRQVDSYHRIIAASNNNHAAYVEEDDRRKFVLRLSDSKKGDWGYWSALDAEINTGGIESLAYDLLNADISEFQIRNKPNTNEHLRQKMASLECVPKWWLDRLGEGQQISSSPEWMEWVSTTTLYEDFNKSANLTRSRWMPSLTEFTDSLKHHCPNVISNRKGSANQRKRGFEFPSLKECRADFEKILGGQIEWAE